MKKSNGTSLAIKPKTRFNGRQTSNSTSSMLKNLSKTTLNSSKKNSILNYVESKASTSNCRITRQNKKRQTSNNFDDTEEVFV
jgi:hypothetical protein